MKVCRLVQRQTHIEQCVPEVFCSSMSIMEMLSVMVLKTQRRDRGGGRMALIVLGLSVGPVQLMMLNLLQAVVIMADISLLRVTKAREGNFARPRWFILCQAVHCQHDHRACPGWTLEKWEQYGHPLECLGKDQRYLLKTFIRMVPKGRRNTHCQMIRRKP